MPYLMIFFAFQRFNPSAYSSFWFNTSAIHMLQFDKHAQLSMENLLDRQLEMLHKTN